MKTFALFGILGLIVLGLAWAWSRSSFKRGKTTAIKDALEGNVEARERQDEAMADARGGDLLDDLERVRKS